MKKKILLRVTTSANTVKWHIANSLDSLKEHYDVIIIGNNVSSLKNEYPFIKFVDIEIKRKIHPLSDFVVLIKLIYYFIYFKPYIVHTIMPKAGFLSAIAAFISFVPLRIHTFTGQVWQNKRGLFKTFLIYMDKLINILNTQCLTDSPSQSLFLHEYGIKHNNKPLTVLGSGSLSGFDVKAAGLNVPKEYIDDLKSRHGLEPNDYICSYIARKTFDKGMEDVLLVFNDLSKEYENIKLLFIGPKEERYSNKMKKILSHNKNIIELDMVNNHFDYLRITDILLLPSYREGFGSIVIDAASMSVPSIGYNISGLSDAIVDKKTGFLSLVGDINSYKNKIRMMLDNNKLRIEMGENAKIRVFKYFTSEKVVEYQLKFYKDL